jgi:putative transposase
MCTLVYNWALQCRKEEYAKNKKSLNFPQQCLDLTILRKDHPHFENVHSQILQSFLKRAQDAYTGFFARVRLKKQGLWKGKVGVPRFKSEFKSFTLKQEGNSWKLEQPRKLVIPGVGRVFINIHRKIEGVMKTCTVKKEYGKWKAYIVCEVENKTIPTHPNENSVGCDLGITNYATFSNEDALELPPTKKINEEIEELQSTIDKLPDSNKKERLQKRKLKKEEKRRNKKDDWFKKETKKIARKYKTIYVEDLSIQDMIDSSVKNTDKPEVKKEKRRERKPKAKNIYGCAWGEFVRHLTYQAESAGCRAVKVDAGGTSQVCHRCGRITWKRLDQRTHVCSHCGCSLGRDLNSSKEIHNRGLVKDGKDPMDRAIDWKDEWGEYRKAKMAENRKKAGKELEREFQDWTSLVEGADVFTSTRFQEAPML